MVEKKKGTKVAEVKQTSLLAKFGKKYSVEPTKVYETLCKTAFKDAQNVEQVIALLVVADQYGLNPFTKEIFAFPDVKTGAVVPVVGIDGWNRIAQQHPQFDGLELRYSEETTIPEDGKECHEWIEAVIYRKDREHAVVVREFLDECYKPLGKYPDGNKHKPGPWQTHTKRMLRHKALIQGYRIAFGFHGIYDPDEAANFIDIEGGAVIPERLTPPPQPNLSFAESSEKAAKESAEQEGGEPPAVEPEATGEAPAAADGEEESEGSLGL